MSMLEVMGCLSLHCKTLAASLTSISYVTLVHAYNHNLDNPKYLQRWTSICWDGANSFSQQLLTVEKRHITNFWVLVLYIIVNENYICNFYHLCSILKWIVTIGDRGKVERTSSQSLILLFIVVNSTWYLVKIYPLFITDKNSHYVAQKGPDVEHASLCPVPWLPWKMNSLLWGAFWISSHID